MLIKTLHVACVLLSGAGFFVRGIWMMTDSDWLNRKWVKIAPHVIDTVLLASAIVLTLQIKQYPLTHDWLTAKVIGLLAYIGFGMVALRRGRTRYIRIGFWCLALLAFAYIVAVAFTRQPLPFFSVNIDV